MELKLPAIAPKYEIRNFISNINSFYTRSKTFLISKDIFALKQFTTKINSVSKDHNEQNSSIKTLKSISSLNSFFDQLQIPHSQEIPLTNLEDTINLISSAPFGLQICFSSYIRSLSLIIKYFLSANFTNFDQINKNLIQKAIDIIHSLPIKSLFYPEIYQHPLIDFEFLNYHLSSPTSICVSDEFIFTCCKRGSITKYQKNRITSVSRNIYSIPADFGICSMIFLNEKLFLINSNQKCISIDTKTGQISDTFSTVLTYPSISDGRYIYCIQFDKKPLIQIFNSHFEKVGNKIELILPVSVSLSIKMPMSTNGSFINFIDNEKCHIFSVLNGRYICTQKVSLSLLSIVYDFTYNGFVCLSENGLVEISAKSTVPPWKLNYKIGYGESNDLKNKFCEALSSLAIHFAGGQNDVPLSEDDESCLESLLMLLSHFIALEEKSEVNENALIGTLALIQVKSRRFDKLPYGVEEKLSAIFCDEKLAFARRAASFLFLSCCSLFERNWNQNCTKLLTMIVDDEGCSDLVFSFLKLFSFDVSTLDETVLGSILNLMANSHHNHRFKSLIILSTIQEKLIDSLPQSEALFTSYVCTLLTKVTQSWNHFLQSGNVHVLSSTCFTTTKILEMQIMKNLDRMDLPLVLIERLFAVSELQINESTNDEQIKKTGEIFNLSLFFALHFTFKRIERKEFVIFPQKADSNHSQISIEDFESIDDRNSKEVHLLLKAANEANWNDKSEVVHFLNATIGKVNDIGELERRIDQVAQIQPQPLRKIHHFLVTGEFITVDHQNSAIFNLMKIEHKSLFYRLSFSLFLPKIHELQDDFLCVPRRILKLFVKNCPVTVLLPLSIIELSKMKLNLQLLDLRDLQLSYDKISRYITRDQSSEFIAPLLNLETNLAPNKGEVKKALLLAIIGFRKSEMNEVTDEIVEKLVYCRKAATSLKIVKLLIEIVKLFAYKGDHRIFNFLVEIAGGCILKKSDIFPGAKNIRTMFQFAYEFVDFSRELVCNSNDFREFLSSHEVLGNDDEEAAKNSHSTLNENDIHVIKKLAFMTIINNLLSFPIVGSEFKAVDHKMAEIDSKISKILENSHKITLENGESYDIRNLFQYDVASPHQIDSDTFNEDQIERIVCFFNIFHKFFRLSTTTAEMTINNSELALKLRPLISILYFTSLVCLSSNTKFISQFHGIYSLSDMITASTQSSGEVINGDELIVLEPINDETVFRRFWEFYSQPSTRDFTIFYSNGGYSTSPISPSSHLCVRFHFTGMCESTLYCCFANSESMSEMRDSSDVNDSIESFVFQEMNDQALVYQTVTFADYFDFVLDADSQQVSLISQDKSVTFPVYNSAIFYSIFIKANKLAFEEKNKQWPLDKLSSFDSYDFSLFKLCRFNHMLTIPCKSFEDSFLNELGIIIRNKCMKMIVPNMIKVKPIEPSLCVSFLNSMLKDYEELFKNTNKKLKTRIKGYIEINSNFDIPKMTQIFIMYVRNTLYNGLSYIIWRNNSYAKPTKKGTIVFNCVIFAPGIIRLADKKTEVEFDCFIVPKEHMNRTAIELMMFSKNALIFCKETNNDVAFNQVVDLMKTCQKEKIPGFTDCDLKSVDTIIKEVVELCQS